MVFLVNLSKGTGGRRSSIRVVSDSRTRLPGSASAIFNRSGSRREGEGSKKPSDCVRR
jgi:hypothetical protein